MHMHDMQICPAISQEFGIKYRDTRILDIRLYPECYYFAGPNVSSRLLWP